MCDEVTDDVDVDALDLRAAVFDALPGQIAVLGPDGTILATNEAWKCFGLDNGLVGDPSAVGENYLAAASTDSAAETGDADSAAAAVEGIRAVLDGDQDEFALEYPCHSPDRERWFRMQAMPLDCDGHRCAVVMHSDITDRYLAEQEVAARNEQLQAVASILSHDLRNPLTVALGRLELIDDEQARVVETALERMNDIVADALTLARLDTPEETSAVDLSTAARSAWSHVATDGATLETPVDAAVVADESLLSQLFENLFRNAVEHGSTSPDPASRQDAAEHGESPVTVTVGPLDDGFYVADDGPGIPPERRVDLFEAGTTSTEGGTGMGLAIVERVADVHGWTVTLAADTDGARFEVTGVEFVA